MSPSDAEFSNARPIDLDEIMAVPGAELIGSLPEATRFRWIERNSRELQTGDLFIGVRGERFDGHLFVADAFAVGATAALVSRDWFGAQVEPAPGPLIIVESPVSALQTVAKNRRTQSPYRVVGITGSLGKTSTKEAIAAGLAGRFATYRSPGNMNSEIGLPLSLLEVPDETEIAVMEMGGAYAFGELALLASIATPYVGVVTNVHPIHLERMGTIEAIAETKTELVESLPAEGFAILNGDDHRVTAMATRTKANVLFIGRDERNDFRAEGVQTRGMDGVTFRFSGPKSQFDVRLPLVGDHAVELALAAIATGAAFGIAAEEVVESMVSAHQAVRLLPLPGPNGSTMLDDTYNASEPSVRSALRLLEEAPAERRIAVLGDMRELGEESEGQHLRIGRRAADVTDILYTYGELARTIALSAAASPRGAERGLVIESFGEDEEIRLSETLENLLQPGDLILLKGSRGLEMERIVRRLSAHAAAGNAE